MFVSFGSIKINSAFGIKCDRGNSSTPFCLRKNLLERTPESDIFSRKMSISARLQADRIPFGYDFDLKRFKDIPCAYCGKEVLSQEGVQYMSALKGNQLVSELERFSLQSPSRLSSNESKALALFEKTALDNPDKNGRELLPIAYTRARNRMLIKQTSVFSRIEKYAKEVRSNELLDYIAKVKNQDVVINPDISPEELSDFLVNKIRVEYRKEILANVINIAGRQTDPKHADTWSKIISAASSMPSSKTDPDAYLVKYISKALRRDQKMENELVLLSDNEAELFYVKLLAPFASSAEHIKPYSDNGESSYSNYLIAHSHCNSRRGNRKWSEYMLSSPERFEHVLHNLKAISSNKHIEDNAADFSIKSYINEVTKTIKSELDDVSDLPRVCEFMDKLTNLASNYTFNRRGKESLITAARIVETILHESNDSNVGRNLEKYLYRTFFRYKQDRKKTFDNLISHLRDFGDEKRLKAMVCELKHKDDILAMESLNHRLLLKILSDEYNINYDSRLSRMIEDLKLNSNSDSVKSSVALIKKKLTPLRKQDAYSMKLILEARQNRGKHDISSLHSRINDIYGK